MAVIYLVFIRQTTLHSVPGFQVLPRTGSPLASFVRMPLVKLSKAIRTYCTYCKNAPWLVVFGASWYSASLLVDVLVCISRPTIEMASADNGRAAGG